MVREVEVEVWVTIQVRGKHVGFSSLGRFEDSNGIRKSVAPREDGYAKLRRLRIQTETARMIFFFVIIFLFSTRTKNRHSFRATKAVRMTRNEEGLAATN